MEVYHSFLHCKQIYRFLSPTITTLLEEAMLHLQANFLFMPHTALIPICFNIFV